MSQNTFILSQSHIFNQILYSKFDITKQYNRIQHKLKLNKSSICHKINYRFQFKNYKLLILKNEIRFNNP